MKMRRRYPTRGGRPVPTVPVPIPLVAAAAMLGAFALGRATGRIRGTGRGPCRATSQRFAGPPRGAVGCGPRREEERTVNGEEAVGA
jgi:hypothetical protein